MDYDKNATLEKIANRAAKVYRDGQWDGHESDRALNVVNEDVPYLINEVRHLDSVIEATANALLASGEYPRSDGGIDTAVKGLLADYAALKLRCAKLQAFVDKAA